MPTYADVAARLSRLDGENLGTGASEENIAAAEQALGLSINGGYREFLSQFGWGGVGHFELFGLGAAVPLHLDLVKVTASERDEMSPRLQHHLLPIMNDGGGNLFCLDTRRGNEPVVVIWEHTQSQAQMPNTVAEDFASWLDGILEGVE